MSSYGQPSGIVYQATNLINGKRYIGVTKRQLKIRADNHWYSRSKKSGHALGKAMARYGREMFRFTILVHCSSIDEALAHEVRLIELLKPEYNLTAGGRGGRGHVVPLSVRNQTSARMKRIGHKVWAASAAAHRKPVIRMKDGAVFESGSAAAKAHKITNCAMSLHLRGINATAAGLIFSFYTGVEVADPFHDEKVKNIRDKQRILMVANTPRRKVVCTTTGKEYSSLRDAEAKVGVPYGCLSRILGRRGLKSWRGLKFEYSE